MPHPGRGVACGAVPGRHRDVPPSVARHAFRLTTTFFPCSALSSLINVYKKAKAGAATLARKTKYTFKELADKVETWSRRDRS
jgi:hypothetical protein